MPSFTFHEKHLYALNEELITDKCNPLSQWVFKEKKDM